LGVITMSARAKQLVFGWLALLSAMPLLALYVALFNGFPDVVATLVIGSWALAIAVLLGLPSAVLSARITQRHPQLPRLFAFGTSAAVALVLGVAGVFAVLVLVRGSA
jgi:hypothetical protein